MLFQNTPSSFLNYKINGNLERTLNKMRFNEQPSFNNKYFLGEQAKAEEIAMRKMIEDDKFQGMGKRGNHKIDMLLYRYKKVRDNKKLTKE